MQENWSCNAADLEFYLKFIFCYFEFVSCGQFLYAIILFILQGLSFMDLKNLNLLNYITNLTYIIAKKLNGKKIEDDEAVKRLVELRVVSFHFLVVSICNYDYNCFGHKL